MQARIAVLKRDLAGMEKEVSMAETVVSPYDGEVLELKVYAGSTVGAGQPILSIQPERDSLELLTYVPAVQAKGIKYAMEVQVSPSTVKREEYGYMKGKVVYVANYPATAAAVMRNFQNESLVGSLTNSGPVTELRVVLDTDPQTISNFRWSTPAGPPVTISSGTICSVQIVTRRQRPISMVFPYIKEKLGLS